ncbi:MAG: AAA family ATPase [Clostridia bacterium]|nr:AAA family ATPase [Clostridia bacterium]
MTEQVKIIATTGKGGVGKTSLSAAFVRILSDKYPDRRILAIDADPAVGLSTALGVEVGITLDDIRKGIVSSVENGRNREAVEMLGEARFRVLDALTEKDGFSFIAIGRPESAGCYCKVNAYLKEIIELITKDFDYVVIDGEAGIEQINRRVMEKVSHLVLVSDGSRKGIQVIGTIKNVADSLVMYDEYGIVINRIPAGLANDFPGVDSEKLLAVIPDDPVQTKNDMVGESVFSLADNSPLMEGARKALSRLGII